jgi:hypothetical protein
VTFVKEMLRYPRRASGTAEAAPQADASQSAAAPRSIRHEGVDEILAVRSSRLRTRPAEKCSEQPPPSVTSALKGASHRALLHSELFETALDPSARAKFLQGLERNFKAFDLGPLQSKARLHESEACLLLQPMVLFFRRFGHEGKG